MTGNGMFICIEGLDKSGKTSQSILLVEALSQKGFDAVYTTEPSNGEIGRFIRRFILTKKRRLLVEVEALLFAADRAEHVEKEIKPLLRDNKIIVSDRYLYSSLAYQGAAGLDLEWIKEINKTSIRPDLALFLDVPVEIVLKRFRNKKSVMEWPNIQRKVKEVYQKIVKDGDLIPVDGCQSLEETAKEIRALVFKKLEI